MEFRWFSVELDEQLIDLVRDNAVLHDLNNRKRKDPMAKLTAWKTIAEELGRNVDQCQMRWKTIRDTHRRNFLRLKVKSTTGSPAMFRSKYSNEALQFLDSTFSKKNRIKTTVSVEQVCAKDDKPCSSKDTPECQLDDQQDGDSFEPKVEQDISEMEEFDDNNSSGEQEHQEDERARPQKKKKKKSALERMREDVNDSKEERNTILEDLLSAKLIKEIIATKGHPVNMFFSSMAEVVKTLPPNLIAEARVKVCKIVSELECRAFEENPNFL